MVNEGDPVPQIIKEIEESEWVAFKTLWSFIPDRRSYLSGLYLRDFYNSPYVLNLFAHVLPKGKFPYFRYYLRNIILLTPGEHALLDQGTEDQRTAYSKKVKTADWGKIDVLRKDLLSEYNAFFPKRKGLIIGIRYSEDEVRQVIRTMNMVFLNKLLKGTVRITKYVNPNSDQDKPDNDGNHK